jgi:predicted ATP-binding protein involved in virulence
MRIDYISISNFKGFLQREFSLHPEFNLIVGTNGTGKTSALDALSVAIGSWFLGVRGADSRHIRASEVQLARFGEASEKAEDVSWERAYPCQITARGEVQRRRITWKRALNAPNGRTTYGEAVSIKRLAAEADKAIRAGGDSSLPLISYYGTGRLWQEPRESFQVSSPEAVTSKDEQSRLAGYWNSVDPRLSVGQFTRWIARQSWIAYQQGGKSNLVFSTVVEAIVRCIEGAKSLRFDASLGEVIVQFEHGIQPFSNLSDGQRCMLAMIGDLAQKAAKLNPHLGGRVLAEVNGVVLIDELDLHLHPRWQRRVIEDLRTTFPRVQFVCTTHSPFLIQSLRSGEELIMLDGVPAAEVSNMSIEQIAEGIQGVEGSRVSERYAEMKDVAKEYLRLLDASIGEPVDESIDVRARLAAKLSPYADNPAFQAFLEMQRVAKFKE